MEYSDSQSTASRSCELQGVGAFMHASRLYNDYKLNTYVFYEGGGKYPVNLIALSHSCFNREKQV